jgi:enamine deaminase RidA (YjgF/YER057c/UK114 family)
MVASGIAVKPGAALYLSEGALPTVGGDMKTQALSTLESLKSHLAEAGASFRDVVFLRAYLVPVADGSVDRDGWNAAYTTFFNNPGQPHKPGAGHDSSLFAAEVRFEVGIDLIAVVPLTCAS